MIDLAKALSPEREPTSEFKKSCKQAFELIFQSLRHSIQDEAKAIIPDKAFTFESKVRKAYIEDIKKRLNLDIQAIRESNKAKKSSSSSSKNTLPP